MPGTRTGSLWDSPIPAGTHGFSFHFSSTTARPKMPLIVPGSHTKGRADIKAMAARLILTRRPVPDAVPILAKPGDAFIHNRQAVHGSFANLSPERRVTYQFGFHRKRSVLGVKSQYFGLQNGMTWTRSTSSELLPHRAGNRGAAEHFPHEVPFDYAPLRGEKGVAGTTRRRAGRRARKYYRHNSNICTC